MYRRAATITVDTLAAGAEETYTITEQVQGSPRSYVKPASSDRSVPDIVVVNPSTSAETGWGITKAWVSAKGEIKFSASNFGATQLTGGSLVVYYAVLR